MVFAEVQAIQSGLRGAGLVRLGWTFNILRPESIF